MAHALDILTLLAIPGIGRRTVKKLLRALENRPSPPEKLHAVLTAVQKTYLGFEAPSLREIRAARKKALEIRRRCRRLAVKILVPGAQNFPPRLSGIPDSPVILFVRGSLECLGQDAMVAVVGTREPSLYGIKAAERLGGLFAQKGWTVVSGLARGCDAAAHEGCLKAKGKTVAVLAHGLDIIYPPENRLLAARILKTGGCLVSEHAPGIKAEKYHFMERDRLQSGLSRGVFVIETDLAGGTMHTIHYALAQGKPLACLKHPGRYQHSAQIEGNKKFIASGEALPVRSKEDVYAFIRHMTFSPVR